SSCTAYLFSITLRPPPTPPLFPYTTLFRSGPALGKRQCSTPEQKKSACQNCTLLAILANQQKIAKASDHRNGCHNQQRSSDFIRSEEHTSELQSRENLVCRLLLEKKKIATC